MVVPQRRNRSSFLKTNKWGRWGRNQREHWECFLSSGRFRPKGQPGGQPVLASRTGHSRGASPVCGAGAAPTRDSPCTDWPVWKPVMRPRVHPGCSRVHHVSQKPLQEPLSGTGCAVHMRCPGHWQNGQWTAPRRVGTVVWKPSGASFTCQPPWKRREWGSSPKNSFRFEITYCKEYMESPTRFHPRVTF